MNPLSREAAIETLNSLWQQRVPFLMFCDYALSQNYVVPLAAVDPRVLLFDFGGCTNARQTEATPPLTHWQAVPPSFCSYSKAIGHVIAQAKAGNTYLANLTFPSSLTTSLSLRQMFFAFQAKFKLHFAGHFTVFSPEPFVTVEGSRISTFPMKGTIAASLPGAEAALMANVKEAAEHATIVDLMRNDLSQVASGVVVDRYRYVERIHSPAGDILQTSSQISGNLFPHLQGRLGSVLYSLLPAGSITGAPKPKTLQIIAEAEQHERGFYTGVFGLFDGHSFRSAVAIRFVEQTPGGSLFFHTGGGITAQSNPQEEYNELILKTQPPIAHP